MKEQDQLISIKILDKHYKIKCPVEQIAELREAAEYVNEQMKRWRQSSHIINPDSLAIVTALNICQEWMQLKKQKNQYIDCMQGKIKMLQHRIQQFLATEEEILV